MECRSRLVWASVLESGSVRALEMATQLRSLWVRVSAKQKASALGQMRVAGWRSAKGWVWHLAMGKAWVIEMGRVWVMAMGKAWVMAMAMVSKRESG
jgi:hypothetical protein